MEMKTFMEDNIEFGSVASHSFSSRLLEFEAGSWRALGSARFIEGLYVDGLMVSGSGAAYIHDGTQIYLYE
jgi:hypothetical protein